MALIVYYDKIIGRCKYDYNGKMLELSLCSLNSDLWAVVGFFPDRDSGKTLHSVFGFVCSCKHLENMLKDRFLSGLDREDDYIFYSSCLTTEIWEGIRLLVEYGKNVSIINK